MKASSVFMIIAVIIATPACWITDDQTIKIHATPEQVYDYISVESEILNQ